MQKPLSIKQISIQSLSFIGQNIFLLLLMALVSFALSYFILKWGASYKHLTFFLYGIFIYLFYYVFISLYYEQKPVFSAEKLVNSFIKLLSIFALSLFVLICFKFGIYILRYFSKRLVGFPDLYAFLKGTYTFLANTNFGQLLIYLVVITFLSFTFFIPGFSWISSLNGKDSSIMTAYAKVSGNYLKVCLIFVILYAVLPLISGLINIYPTPVSLGITYSVLTIVQLVFCLHLYDALYEA